MKELPFFDEMMRAASVASEIVGAGLRKKSEGKTLFACLPIYGDGSAPQLLNIVGDDGQAFVVSVIDLRYALECLSHICCSPLGRYSPSVDLSVALEKLSLATRIACLRDPEFAHLSLGLLSEAQNEIYPGASADHPIVISKLVSEGFLAADQVSKVLQAAVCFQIFHEYGHHVTKHQGDFRQALEQNLANYIEVYSTRLEHQAFHDQENAKLAREMVGDAEFDLILTSDTSRSEYARLIEARLTARQDKDELLCDNFAMQNTAKLLVEHSGLGSPDWVLIRYTIEHLLMTSWSIGSSRPIFSLACGTWNKEARQELSEEDREEATKRLESLIDERRQLVLSQRLRLKYALEQFDAVMGSLLHSVLQSGVNVRDAIDRYGPSSSMARIMHEFSGRHVNQVDRSLYTIDGLGRCSSRGRALQTLLAPGARQQLDTVADLFAFYVLGSGFHFSGPH